MISSSHPASPAAYLDEVLRGEGLKDRNEEVDDMFISTVLTLEEKVLVMKDKLTVHIFHQDPKCLNKDKFSKNDKMERVSIHLRSPMYFIIPLEVRSNG